MNPTRDIRITQVWLESLTAGVVELERDWKALHPPPLKLLGTKADFAAVTRVPDYVYAAESGYFVNKKGEIFFVLQHEQHPHIDWANSSVYLAGDFNGWQNAVEKDEWLLAPSALAGKPVLLWTGKADRFFADPALKFKFVTGKNEWLDVPSNAPNWTRDANGNTNRYVDPNKTGRHLFRFTASAPISLSDNSYVQWGDGTPPAPVRPGNFFYSLSSDLPLGALAEREKTTFRIFAPRATKVALFIAEDPMKLAAAALRPLKPAEDGTWDLVIPGNLHGWLYWYKIDGPVGPYGQFDFARKILDPYAKATMGREGPGIVLSDSWIGKSSRHFQTPAWQDLVVAEAHVRDLSALAPVRLTPPERLGFSGLRRWVESPDFYLKHLGVNCVELQPIQEFDNVTTDEYHWGYMTNNYFAPESSYSLDPLHASGVKEFQELVAAFHRQGIAVLLDVVYNHVGEPAHLIFVDKLYYFDVGKDGSLANWSGCGNDIRADSAMAKRMIVDSCVHLIEAYGIDGFRFDLAELIGVSALKDIEVALKKVKPDVILIAEPWSFRGHIAGALRPTGWASWNDGYRNFIREYVLGGSSQQAFEYFLKGSPWFYATWPAQTVNYAESHDDRTWIDMITENPNNNGFVPTANDRRRTHLMCAVLMMSIGIPMLSSGQDFLRSKRGVNNTYQRGDLNALDYRRMFRFPSTHAYFADWIAFRKSARGKLLRLFSRPNEGYFQFFFSPDSNAAAAVYNADRSAGSLRLLFAVNPTLEDRIILLGKMAHAPWRQICDHERFFYPGGFEPTLQIDDELEIPGLVCGLWACET